MTREGTCQLSKKKLDGLKVWDNVSEVCESKAVVEGKITEVNKGQLGCQHEGRRVFIPPLRPAFPRAAI